MNDNLNQNNVQNTNNENLNQPQAPVIDIPVANETVATEVTNNSVPTNQGNEEVRNEPASVEAEENKNKNKKKEKKVKEKKPKEDPRLKKLLIKQEELRKKLNSGEIVRSETPIAYKFIAKDASGKIVDGEIIGNSILDIHTFLVNKDYEVYDIAPKSNKATKPGGRKMAIKDLQFLLTQLSTYLKAGITLADAVDILGKQMSKDKNKARVFQSLSYELTMGEAFSKALEKQGNVFPQLLINMIRAAEATGEIIETLDDMAVYYTEMNKTRKQMKSALTYPIIISVIAVAVLTFILVWVVPQFVEIYTQSGIEPTGITAIVIGLSKFLKNYLILLIAIVAAIIALLIFAYQKSKSFRRTIQTFMMKMPVFKNVIIYNEMTIFTKTFASLLKNQIDINESMEILEKITNNEIYKEVMRNTISNVSKGEKISDAFKGHWAVPDVAYYMMVTGESTGELPSMLLKVSDYYSEQHRNTVNSLKTFIEPLTIGLLAFVVGFILIAVIVPMFSLYETIE
ncbi:MAG: type II secretion system F family protein [Bacilli bacterium]|nr:type II secretion system F family protein [Bacilli bacterium]